MTPMIKCWIWATIPVLMIACGPDKKEPARKLDRELIGEELAFGRDAAEFELWNEAIFRWEKVLEREPDNPRAVNNLAVAYETVGNFEKAADLYRRALDLQEDDPRIRRNYKRFLSFYKKHQRQLAREQRARERRQAEAEDRRAQNNEGGNN